MKILSKFLRPYIIIQPTLFWKNSTNKIPTESSWYMITNHIYKEYNQHWSEHHHVDDDNQNLQRTTNSYYFLTKYRNLCVIDTQIHVIHSRYKKKILQAKKKYVLITRISLYYSDIPPDKQKNWIEHNQQKKKKKKK